MENVNIINGNIDNVDISNSNIFINQGKKLTVSGDLILNNKSISGNKINGGTIDEITISKLLGPIDFLNNNMENVNISNGTINNVDIISNNITVSNQLIGSHNFIIKPSDNLDLDLSGTVNINGNLSVDGTSSFLNNVNYNNYDLENVNIVSGNITNVSIQGELKTINMTGEIKCNRNQIKDAQINGGTIYNITSIQANEYSGSGVINNLDNVVTTSTKLVTAGAIKSYILAATTGLDTNAVNVDFNDVIVKQDLLVEGDGSFNNNLTTENLIVNTSIITNGNLDVSGLTTLNIVDISKLEVKEIEANDISIVNN